MVICTTNKSFKDFRRDLWTRLYPFYVPAIHERRIDIFAYLIWFFKGKGWKYFLTPRDILSLLSYNWPGNVREIESVAFNIMIYKKLKLIDINKIKADFIKPNKKNKSVTQIEPKIDQGFLDFLKEQGFLKNDKDFIGVPHNLLSDLPKNSFFFDREKIDTFYNKIEKLGVDTSKLNNLLLFFKIKAKFNEEVEDDVDELIQSFDKQTSFIDSVNDPSSYISISYERLNLKTYRLIKEESQESMLFKELEKMLFVENLEDKLVEILFENKQIIKKFEDKVIEALLEDELIKKEFEDQLIKVESEDNRLKELKLKITKELLSYKLNKEEFEDNLSKIVFEEKLIDRLMGDILIKKILEDKRMIELEEKLIKKELDFRTSKKKIENKISKVLLKDRLIKIFIGDRIIKEVFGNKSMEELSEKIIMEKLVGSKEDNKQIDYPEDPFIYMDLNQSFHIMFQGFCCFCYILFQDSKANYDILDLEAFQLSSEWDPEMALNNFYLPLYETQKVISSFSKSQGQYKIDGDIVIKSKNFDKKKLEKTLEKLKRDKRLILKNLIEELNFDFLKTFCGIKIDGFKKIRINQDRTKEIKKIDEKNPNIPFLKKLLEIPLQNKEDPISNNDNFNNKISEFTNDEYTEDQWLGIYFERLNEICNGYQKKMAKIADLTEPTIHRRLKHYGLLKNKKNN